MGKSVNVQGQTVEEAIQKGLAELGVTRDQVEIVLLSSSGGSTEGDVLVQLTVSDEADLNAPMPPLPRAQTEPSLFGGTITTGLAAQETPSGEGAAHPVGVDTPTIAQHVLERILKGMGIRSQVVIRYGEAEDEGPDFVLDIIGADLGILIGRRGETLRDMEYLTRLIVAQQIKRPMRFAVDVEGYRARRERVLRELAKRMADRVRQNRQPITLEAMPPHERRIVHITLREHPNVRTQSIGEGDRRRVMILPK